MKEKTFVNDETARESSIHVLRFTYALDFFVIMSSLTSLYGARESKHYYKIMGRPS